MMQNGFNRGYYEDSGSRDYDVLSTEYATMWGNHSPDPHHYEQVRSRFMRWMSALQRGGIQKQEGALVMCGPGFNVTDQDLSREMVSGMLTEHPEVVVADFAPEVLKDTADRLVHASREIGTKLSLTRRDFSYGLSAKFHQLISGKLERVVSVHDLRDFFSSVRGDVGIDEVRRENILPAHGTMRFNRQTEATLAVDEAMSFDSVLQTQADVRFITANTMLAGLFAVTEREVRERLELHQGELGQDEVGTMLEAWHRLIADLNTEVAATFMIHGLRQNPRASIFAPTDVNTQYEHIDTFNRLNLDQLKRRVEEAGFNLKMRGQWTWNDMHDTIPHTHLMELLLACANGTKSTSALADESGLRKEGDSGIGIDSADVQRGGDDSDSRIVLHSFQGGSADTVTRSGAVEELLRNTTIHVPSGGAGLLSEDAGKLQQP